METTIKKNIYKLFDADVDYHFLTTFRAELNRQCNLMLVPAAIVAIFSWLPYIPLDMSLFSEIRVIILFRLGFTLLGIVILILHFTPFFKNKNYWLLFSLICYLELASPVIAGLVKADSAYMTGYAMLVLLIPLLPFNKIHSITMMSSSLFLFIAIGFFSKINFDTWGEIYGLNNLAAATLVSFIGIFVLDNIRKVGYEKNKLNYLTNMKLKVATMDIFQINEELKTADTFKSKLLEIAAHDLRNPLQGIIECIRILEGEVKEDRLTAQKLHAIHRSTENMLRLITRLLKSLSIESGKLVLNKRDVDIGKLAETVISESKPNFEKKNQKILFTAEEKCMVNGDEMLLKEVFENLLSNAVKFSFPGKSIWVNVGRHGSVVTFSVRDEGPGLNEEDKKKMFGRFQKLSAKPTGGESSTGLGLAITRDLIEMHDGKIRAESEPGQGSTFIVRIPKASAYFV
ncbi:MAG: hypothetical protein KAT34_18470 [Candidatus Aminicenantes bacterium]|nr:hypothetical protein [Candidatus Aminicenantes bacterium]